MTHPNGKPAPLELEHGTLAPDRSLAAAAHRSLVSYLHNIDSGALTPSLDNKEIKALPIPIEPRLDENGYWRLGVWLLEGRSGSLALTYRPTQADPRIEYVAMLHGDTETLKVVGLTRRQLHPRR